MCPIAAGVTTGPEAGIFGISRTTARHWMRLGAPFIDTKRLNALRPRLKTNNTSAVAARRSAGAGVLQEIKCWVGSFLPWSSRFWL